MYLSKSGDEDEFSPEPAAENSDTGIGNMLPVRKVPGRDWKEVNRRAGGLVCPDPGTGKGKQENLALVRIFREGEYYTRDTGRPASDFRRFQKYGGE